MPDTVLPPRLPGTVPKSIKEALKAPIDLLGARELIRSTHNGTEADPIIDSLARAVAAAAEAANQIPEAVTKILGNQMRTEVQNLANAKKVVGQMRAPVLVTLDKARDGADHAIAELDGAMLPQRKKDTIEAVAAIDALRVQHRLVPLKAEERMKLIDEAIEDGDESFMDAVINGSRLLSGLTKAEHAMVRHKWQAKWHGEHLNHVTR